MKHIRLLAVFALLALCLGIFVGCKNESGSGSGTEAVYYTVKFNSNGGATIEPKTVKSGQSVDEPPVPERDGYIFDGWYDGARKWDFAYSVKGDMTLVARWIEAGSLFEHTPTGDGETTTITKLKNSNQNEIRIPTYMGGYKVTAIGDRVFYSLNSENVSLIVVPDTVTSIGEEAFANTDNVEIVIEGELIHIGEKAFYGCDGLKSIKLGNIETIAPEAFVSTGLVAVMLPESVKKVDENAFSDCASLISLYVHDSIEVICDSAFYDTDISVVYFFGNDDTLNEFLDSKVRSRNDVILDAKKYIYSENEPMGSTEFNGFWYYNKYGEPRIWAK